LQTQLTHPQRRRAQNRAAQRAFRERKEKHARDLEVQLNELTTKYRSLETSHAELTAAYDKLQKTLELLTQKEETECSNGSAETLRKFLTILHGEMKIKAEMEGKE
jgi:AP-1-like transcription factor